jgi:hypothetical protein
MKRTYISVFAFGHSFILYQVKSNYYSLQIKSQAKLGTELRSHQEHNVVMNKNYREIALLSLLRLKKYEIIISFPITLSCRARPSGSCAEACLAVLNRVGAGY